MTEEQTDKVIALLIEIRDLLQEQVGATNYATEQAQLATHRDGCKCGGH